MGLLERDESLAVLESLLGGARSGSGSLVLVTGEAGIGKSSLVRTLCDQHARSMSTWWGACDALSTPRPLGPLHDIARGAGGHLAELLTSDASRHDRFNGLLDALTPSPPVITVVEDMHWADDATRDLLVFLARRIARTHALVIVTYRDDELSTDHPLQETLGHLATLGAARLELPRLSEAAVAALAAQYGMDPGRVYEVTSGNPFFVTEVLTSGGSTVPTTVRDAILARATSLPRPAREALEAAAVVPGGAELELVRHVAGCDTASIDDCERVGLLRTTRRTVQFRHELARLAVADAVPGGRAPELHGRVVDYLEKQGDADPARVVYHAEHAGDPSAVVRFAPLAADQAAALGAHRQAQAHLARALDHADALSATERVRLLERYAQECNAVGMFSMVVDAADRALAHWRQLGDAEQVARMTSWRAGPLWNVGRFAEAYQSAEDAVRLMAGGPASPTEAFVLGRAASLRVITGDIAGAVELGSRAVTLADECGDAALLVQCLCGLGTALWFVDPERAEQALRRALAIARESGDDVGVSTAMGRLGSGAGEVRRYAIADHWLSECARWAAERDLDYYLGHALSWMARSAFEQGRWAAAQDALDRLGSAREMPHISTNILTVAGRMRVRRGDPDADPPLAEAWQLACETNALQRLWPVASARAEAAWLAGKPEQIPELAGDTYELARSTQNHPWATGELAFWMWRAGGLHTAPAGAAAPYALQINGDWRAAAAAWDAHGCPYEAALARADSSDPGDLSTAFETFARLGADPMTAVVAARLRDRGVRSLPRRPTRTTLENPGGLTARELEVLNLIIADHTNPEIGATLHISAKTASHHVSAILAKLGVRTRREAARIARERGVVPPEIGQ